MHPAYFLLVVGMIHGQTAVTTEKLGDSLKFCQSFAADLVKRESEIIKAAKCLGPKKDESNEQSASTQI